MRPPHPYHVAIVGSGLSGFFASAALLRAADASEDFDIYVDMLEMLPTPWGLARTGIADHALETLRPRGVREVVLVGRRGPPQAAFTTLELRELADLEGVDVIVDPAQLDGITDEDAAAAGKTVKQHIKALRDYAGREPRPGHRRLVFRFMTSPIEIKGDGKVESIVLGRNKLVIDAGGRVTAEDTGEREELPTQLVVRSVGYRGVPIPGLPFDERSRTIPHTDGRIAGRRNEYVVGWIKRGPSGVIGTDKKDSQDTVDTLIADLSGAGADEPAGHEAGRADELAEWLSSRQSKLVTAAHWQLIDRYERAAGEAHGRPRQTARPGGATAHRPRLDERRRPPQRRSPGRGGLDGELAAGLRRTPPQPRQAGAGAARGSAATVVAHLDTQIVADGDPDRHRTGPGVPHGVDERLGDHRLGVVGQGALDHRQRPDELHAGAQVTGEPGDRVVDPFAQRGPRRRSVQAVDGRLDLLDDTLQVVDGVGESSLHFGNARERNGDL